MLRKPFPVMEQMEARQLLSVEFRSVEWTLGMTNTVDSPDGTTYSSYLMWFQRDLPSICQDVDLSGCMQDYSWLGAGFEPTTFKGAPAVNYVGGVAYVVDPAARRVWSVDAFLKEYPHALDGLSEGARSHVDLYRVDTDLETGVKTVILSDFNHVDGDFHAEIVTWSSTVTLEGVPLEKAMDKARSAKATKLRHKKPAHHHKAPAKKHSESLLMNRRLAAVRG